ncbi:MAG: glycosyltransferase N-terminal domain-containing protein [Aliishimia sp.]
MAAPRSLSLAAYRALTRRGAAPRLPKYPPRPDGELAWIHLGTNQDMRALLDLAERLHQTREPLTVLLTRTAEDETTPWPKHTSADHLVFATAPNEHPDAVAAFLDHWNPDVGLWVWGALRPNLVDISTARGVPLHLVSADKAGFDGQSYRWLPELSRHLGGCFLSASARSASSAQRLARIGVPPERIIVLPPLRPSGRILPCAQSDQDEMAQQLKGRPVWLAAEILSGEYPAIIEAHRQAIRSAHRLLLVINPTNTNDIQDITEMLERAGLTHTTWGNGTYPKETTQVLIADCPDELGLWYRIASVSFLGGSLVVGHGGRDPMVAASLGTAILYGPNIGAHLGSYARLAQAGAARIVKDASTLSNSVVRLIAPDLSATMAHAGWDVVTEGAEIVDGVIDLVQDSLDERLAEKAKASVS